MMNVKPKSICRVCGKEYDTCRTPNPSGIFRWRDVACSPRCGQIYLTRIMESRNGAASDDVHAEHANERVPDSGDFGATDPD